MVEPNVEVQVSQPVIDDRATHRTRPVSGHYAALVYQTPSAIPSARAVPHTDRYVPPVVHRPIVDPVRIASRIVDPSSTRPPSDPDAVDPDGDGDDDVL
jgi:hypothetical protein